MSLDTTKNGSQDLQTILSKIGKVAGCVKVFDMNTIALHIHLSHPYNPYQLSY